MQKIHITIPLVQHVLKVSAPGPDQYLAGIVRNESVVLRQAVTEMKTLNCETKG